MILSIKNLSSPKQEKFHPLENKISSFQKLPLHGQKEILKKVNSSERQYLLNSYDPNFKTSALRQSIFTKMTSIENDPPKLVKNDEQRIYLLPVPIRRFLKNTKIFFLNGLFTVFHHTSATSAINQLMAKSREGLPKIALEKGILLDDNQRKITQSELENIIKNFHKNRQVNEVCHLAEELKKRGFDPIISEIYFPKSANLKHFNFVHLTFDRCKFDYCKFGKSIFTNSIFFQCSLKNCSFLKSHFQNSSFIECLLKDNFFSGATLKEVEIEKSSLIACNFEDTQLEKSLFKQSNLPGTHFLNAEIQECEIFECNLTDTIFFDNQLKFSIDSQSKKTASLTRPLSVILSDSQNKQVANPKVYMKAQLLANTIPLRMSLKSVLCDKKLIKKEIEEGLKAIKSIPFPSYSAKYIEFVNEAHFNQNESRYPQSQTILKKAKLIANKVHGIILPGGIDIPPLLYGEKPLETTDWGNDYCSSILELALIKESVSRGIPLIGLCRGFQMANIYFGGKLTQEVTGQTAVQRIIPLKKSPCGFLGPLIQPQPWVAVAHHQAIKPNQEAKTYLEPAGLSDNYVKASEPVYGGAAPAFLLQFHPEFLKSPTALSAFRSLIDKGISSLLSRKNEIFWKLFKESVDTYSKKKLMIENFKLKTSLTQ